MKHLLFLLVNINLAGTVSAQNIPSFQCDFNHMAFSVKDLKASVDFYRRVLNLHEITNRSQKDNIRWLSMGSGKELHLISGVNEPVHIIKAVHLALSTENIHEVVNHLKNMGINFSDWAGIPNTLNVRADGVKQIYFQDPDGYWIEVNSGYEGQPRAMNVQDTIWKMEEDYWVYVKNKTT
jgi:lactoylglutathione lyase